MIRYAPSRKQSTVPAEDCMPVRYRRLTSDWIKAASVPAGSFCIRVSDTLLHHDKPSPLTSLESALQCQKIAVNAKSGNGSGTKPD